MDVRFSRCWWVIGLLVGLCWACPVWAQSFESRLIRWLDEPDVKLVAVEFYSDYCEPCKEAAPRWERLRTRYQDQGLKLVVINVDDYDSARQCKTLPWRPDVLKCDLKMAQELGVCDPRGRCKVPQAFLWSWEGNLVVEGEAHIGAVEEATKRYFKAAPRVLVEATDERGRPDAELQRQLEEELGRDGKVTIVSGRSDRARLAALRRKTQAPERRDDQQCEEGQEVSPNMWLTAERFPTSLSLSLQSIGKSCGTTVTADFDSRKPRAGVQKAVYRLMDRLKRRPPRLPGTDRSTRNTTEGGTLNQPFQRECPIEEADACLKLAGQYKEGRGVRVDLPRSCELYQAICTAKNLTAEMRQQTPGVPVTRACVALAAAYSGGGRGVQRSRRRSIEILQLMCDLGNGGGCSLLKNVPENQVDPRDAPGANRSNGDRPRPTPAHSDKNHLKASDFTASVGIDLLGLLLPSVIVGAEYAVKPYFTMGLAGTYAHWDAGTQYQTSTKWMNLGVVLRWYFSSFRKSGLFAGMQLDISRVLHPAVDGGLPADEPEYDFFGYRAILGARLQTKFGLYAEVAGGIFGAQRPVYVYTNDASGDSDGDGIGSEWFRGDFGPELKLGVGWTF